jgi:hypothetical protein
MILMRGFRVKGKDMPILYGVLTAAAFISVTALIFRAVGFTRPDAVYAACVVFALLLYSIGQRKFRRE